jgi:hypothetical protein
MRRETFLIAITGLLIGLPVVLLPSIVTQAQSSPKPAPMPELTPEQFQTVVTRRETLALLTPMTPEPIPSQAPGKDFKVFTAVELNAPMAEVRAKILDFPDYKNLTSVITDVVYVPRRKIVLIKGSFLRLPIKMIFRVEERSLCWIHFVGLLSDTKNLPVDVYLKTLSPGPKEQTLLILTGTLHVESSLIPDLAVEQTVQLLIVSLGSKLRAKLESRNSAD